MLCGGYFGFGVSTTPPATTYTKPPDPQLKPVEGDEIDALVNQQLSRGQDGR